MTSNIKPKNSAKEAPTEPFKRAVGVCLRAIAGKGDIEVAFAAERPGLAGGKARLPEPPRRLNEGEAAIVRGHADSIALRLACHDPAVHRKLVPGDRWQVFEQHTFRGADNALPEPRECVVADVTGDGKNDLIVLVHDRILVYPQE